MPAAYAPAPGLADAGGSEVPGGLTGRDTDGLGLGDGLEEGEGLRDGDGDALGLELGLGEADGDGGEEALVVGTEVGTEAGTDRLGVTEGLRTPGDGGVSAAGDPWNAARTTRNPPANNRNTRNATSATIHRPRCGGDGGGGPSGPITSVPQPAGARTAVVLSGASTGVAATGSPCRTRSRSSFISSAEA